MGLDMYLSAEKFVSGYDHIKDENFEKILDLMNIDRKDVENSATVNITIGYWRKANAVHNWFVQNVQNGVDNCQRSYVSPSKLMELRDAAQAALNKLNDGDDEGAVEILTPTAGFFFGGTDADDYYKRDLVETIKIIDKCVQKFHGYDIYYQSSW
jgi:hypothetical protein